MWLPDGCQLGLPLWDWGRGLPQVRHVLPVALGHITQTSLNPSSPLLSKATCLVTALQSTRPPIASGLTTWIGGGAWADTGAWSPSVRPRMANVLIQDLRHASDIGAHLPLD
jgi:hypothetical protein